MAIELLDKANENFNKKQGTDEHVSLLPEMEHMISQMYNIPKHNYVLNGMLLPNLDEYNVHYDSSKFQALANTMSQKSAEVNQNASIHTGMVR